MSTSGTLSRLMPLISSQGCNPTEAKRVGCLNYRSSKDSGSAKERKEALRPRNIVKLQLPVSFKRMCCVLLRIRESQSRLRRRVPCMDIPTFADLAIITSWHQYQVYQACCET